MDSTKVLCVVTIIITSVWGFGMFYTILFHPKYAVKFSFTVWLFLPVIMMLKIIED